jgi:putative ABC transport system permease protein
MPDRWTLLCRRLAPSALRDVAFDPAVADLAVGRAASDARQTGRIGRLVSAAAFGAAVLAVALECRRLGGRPRVTGPRPAGWLAARGRDLRSAARRLRQEPVFALFAAATLAISIGVNVALFSMVDAYLLAPLPVPSPDGLVRVYGGSADRRYDVVSYPNYADARDGTPGLDLAAHVATTVFVGTDDSNDAQPLELVTGNYFRVLNLLPVAGRLIEPQDDDVEGAHPVVVIGEGFWRTRFRGRRDAVGQTLRLNDAPYTIIGVVPASFQGTSGAELTNLWAPVSMQQQLRPRSLDLTVRAWGWLRMIGRLAPGATLGRMRAELDSVAAGLNRRFPSKHPLTFTLSPASVLEEPDRQALLPFVGLTFVFSGLLLLVSCANLAGLMQARATGRRREFAIRQSLGAGRGRLAAEWLAESAILAGAGAAGALGLTVAADWALARFRPPAQLVGRLQIAAPIDWRVFAFAVAVAGLTVVLVGLVPAWRASADAPVALLKEDTVTTSGGRRGTRLRRATVFVQVVAAAVLLVASGLLVASLRNLRHFDPGFPTGHLAMVTVNLTQRKPTPEKTAAFTAQLLARVRTIAGVTTADQVVDVPLTNNRDSDGFRIPGYVAPDGSTTVSVPNNIVGARYLATLGVPFVAGQSWDPLARAPAAVVNATFARTFLAGRDPIGQSIVFVDHGPLTIVGVVRDSVYYQIGEQPMPFVFLPAELGRPTGFTVLARTAGDPAAALPAMARAVTATDARVRPAGLTTFEQARAVELYPRRVLAWASSAFGAVALLLAAIGLFGVVSTSVGQRTREIGIRMALGARPGGVLAGVLGESAVLVGAGAIVGLAGATAVTGFLRQWLFGVAPVDAGVYLAAACLLAAATLAAAWVPARRASRIDPIAALRS